MGSPPLLTLMIRGAEHGLALHTKDKPLLCEHMCKLSEEQCGTPITALGVSTYHRSNFVSEIHR